MDETLVSVIMPAYNAAKYIGESIKSVIEQTYTHWELLVVDDCSTDDTYAVIRSHADTDSRIKVFQTPVNSRTAVCRNLAMKYAQGRYLAFLDSDDLWLPHKLERQLQFMHDNNYAFTFTDYTIIQADGTQTGKRIKVPQSIGYYQYLRNTIIGCLTVMIDVKQTGKFEEPRLYSAQDMAGWLQIMKRGFRAYGLNEALSLYRLHRHTNTHHKFRAAMRIWRVYSLEELNVFYAFYCWLGYAFHAIKKRL
jgi:teichuronic acid biosynthesis glycosyltransferase TuaG